MHTGEKPFECDVCHQRYSTKSNLTVHRKKHSADTEVPKKEHRCPRCDKLHASKKTLAKHIKRQVSPRSLRGPHRAFQRKRVAGQKHPWRAHSSPALSSLSILQSLNLLSTAGSGSLFTFFISAVAVKSSMLEQDPPSVLWKCRLQHLVILVCLRVGFWQVSFRKMWF